MGTERIQPLNQSVSDTDVDPLAGLGHFDLSFWAFEQLAHPLYGIQMLEYRAVDCDTGAPVPNSYISKTDIYQGGTKAGWNWFPYGDSYSRYAVPGESSANAVPSKAFLY
jgi:cullin-associated NEDD8-dissociated protein 1